MAATLLTVGTKLDTHVHIQSPPPPTHAFLWGGVNRTDQLAATTTRNVHKSEENVYLFGDGRGGERGWRWVCMQSGGSSSSWHWKITRWNGYKSSKTSFGERLSPLAEPSGWEMSRRDEEECFQVTQPLNQAAAGKAQIKMISLWEDGKGRLKCWNGSMFPQVLIHSSSKSVEITQRTDVVTL